MRITLTIAAIAATLATAAAARPAMHHHAMRTDSGSSATRELNEKSLQMASAGGSMTSQPMGNQTMNNPSMAQPSTMSPDRSMSAPANTPPMTPAGDAPMAPTSPPGPAPQ